MTKKSVILSSPAVRALGVNPKNNKKIKVKSRNRKLNKLIYALRRYF